MKYPSILKVFFSSLLLFLFASLFSQNSDKDYTQWVNPMIGTKGILIYGRTTPFVTPPFGMTHWTAANFNPPICRPIYNYLWPKIIGFRGSHKPACCMGDYGYVSLMPVAGAKAKYRTKHSAWFSHRHEFAKPYYYFVRLNSLPKKRVNVEITSTVHCGIFRIAFPKKTEHNLFIETSREMGGWVKIDTERNEVYGYNIDIQDSSISPHLKNFKGYFVLKFNAPIVAYGTWLRDSAFNNKAEQSGILCGARVAFAVDTLMVKVGTSFIALEQARENLIKEIPQWDFAQVENDSKEQWNKYLERIDIETAKKSQRHIFYTSMFHSLLFPRTISEYGRYFSAFDDRIHAGTSYNDYSLWDTYRAEHPLLLFIAPERVPGMIQSLLQMCSEGGWMPKWPNPTYTSIMVSIR